MNTTAIEMGRRTTCRVIAEADRNGADGFKKLASLSRFAALFVRFLENLPAHHGDVDVDVLIRVPGPG